MEAVVRDPRQYAVAEVADDVAPIDLVVPFTTPFLTRAAIEAAEHLGAGLHAAIRLIGVQTVPFPLEPEQSRVDVTLLRRQLAAFRSKLPIKPQVRLARDVTPEILNSLSRESTVVIASRRRPWKTNT